MSMALRSVILRKALDMLGADTTYHIPAAAGGWLRDEVRSDPTSAGEGIKLITSVDTGIKA